jgi:hypothetical protein
MKRSIYKHLKSKGFASRDLVFVYVCFMYLSTSINLFAVLFALSIADLYNPFAIYLILFKFVNLSAALLAFPC